MIKASSKMAVLYVISAKEVSFPCLSVCLLAGLCKYYWLKLHEEVKISDGGSWFNLDCNKCRDLENCLGAPKKFFYLLLPALAEGYTLWWLI